MIPLYFQFVNVQRRRRECTVSSDDTVQFTATKVFNSQRPRCSTSPPYSTLDLFLSLTIQKVSYNLLIRQSQFFYDFLMCFPFRNLLPDYRQQFIYFFVFPRHNKTPYGSLFHSTIGGALFLLSVFNGLVHLGLSGFFLPIQSSFSTEIRWMRS